MGEGHLRGQINRFFYRRQPKLRSNELPGEQEANVIATRLNPPPKGFANWSLWLLARRVVTLEIVKAISHKTFRRTLKKTA